MNQNGKKKTLTLTRQCCYGYGRPRNADFTTPCEKIDIKDVEATASEMGAKQFLESARSSGELADMLGAGNGKKVTLFVPNDAAFVEYRGQQQQENVSIILITSIPTHSVFKSIDCRGCQGRVFEASQVRLQASRGAGRGATGGCTQ